MVTSRRGAIVPSDWERNRDGATNVAGGRKPAENTSLRGLNLPVGLHQPANNGFLSIHERGAGNNSIVTTDLAIYQ